MLLFFKFYPPKSPQTLNIPKISLYIQIPQYMFCWWGWRNNNLSVTIMLPHLYHTHTHCVSTLIASIIYKLQYLYSYTRESTAALLINYTFGQYLFIYLYLSQMRQPRYPIDRIIYRPLAFYWWKSMCSSSDWSKLYGHWSSVSYWSKCLYFRLSLVRINWRYAISGRNIHGCSLCSTFLKFSPGAKCF